jgi:hypothetical protein
LGKPPKIFFKVVRRLLRTFRFFLTILSKIFQAWQGSMLWSQFSAIFATFRREKICVFLKNQWYDRIFLQKLAAVWAKNANIFAKYFGENIFKNNTSAPGFSLPSEIFSVRLPLINIH